MTNHEFYFRAETAIEAREALVVVSNDGTVSWYPHCIFRSSCAVDTTAFPFDKQTCNMWFGSWTHTTDKLDLEVNINMISNQQSLCIFNIDI